MSRCVVGLWVLVCAGVAVSVLLWLRPNLSPPVYERVEVPGLVEIAPGFDYVSWYGKESGFVPTYDHFGAHVIHPMDDRLIVGFGGGLPADTDGALLGNIDGDNLQMLAGMGKASTLWTLTERIAPTAWKMPTSTSWSARTL